MKARFYCANCGTEVPAKAERCPKCGKYFTAVTCPTCGFEGQAESFLKGCPVCGYLVETGVRREHPQKEKVEDSTRLPPLFYGIVGGVLLLLLVVLIVLLLINK